MKKKSKIRKIGFYIILFFIILWLTFPFLYMVLSSLKKTVDIFNMDKMFKFNPTFDNYIQVFTRYSFLKPLRNTSIVSFSATILSLLLGVPAAYAIASSKMDSLSNVILAVKIIPGISYLVPWYLIFTKLKLNGTFTSLILCHMLISLPTIVWIMIPYFEKLPKALEDSALIDGCTHLQAFLRIMLPISGPGLVTATILTFIASWNNFIFGLVLGSAKTQPLPIAIFHFIADTEVNWGGLMAASVVVTIPIIIVTIILQKYIVEGITAGAVKG